MLSIGTFMCNTYAVIFYSICNTCYQLMWNTESIDLELCGHQLWKITKYLWFIFKQSHCQGLTINAYHDFRKTDTVFKQKGKFRAKFPTLDISD